MQTEKELEHKINNIKYDIETIEMEKMGLKKRLTDFKEEIIINAAILIIIMLFFRITIWGNYDNPYSQAFIMVLTPIYYIAAFIYIIFFIMKPIWQFYINSNLKTARQTALKRGINSISVKIEMCDAEISTMNAILRNYEETLINDKLNLS